MLEEGSVATEYEPYFPSNKMIAEEIDEINSNLDGLKVGENCGGKNLWDEQWKNGVYNESDGLFTPISNYFCSKNKIKVKPNTIYSFVSPEIHHYIYKYDVNGNEIDDSDFDLFFYTEKREGWANVYRSQEGNIFLGKRVYASKEKVIISLFKAFIEPIKPVISFSANVNTTEGFDASVVE